MLNLNTAKLQTHVSFGENFVSTCTKSTKWHLPLGCAYKKKIHETARALVSRCAVMFSREIFSRIGATSYKMHPKQVRRAPMCHFVDFFCLNFEVLCRFRILIISIIRENWAINFNEMKDRG